MRYIRGGVQAGPLSTNIYCASKPAARDNRTIDEKYADLGYSAEDAALIQSIAKRDMKKSGVADTGMVAMQVMFYRMSAEGKQKMAQEEAAKKQALATTNAGQIKTQLARMDGELRAALPPHITVDRFRRVAMTAINTNPDLCNSDRRSLLNACLLAAQDGLLPDGREGALVIYNTKERADGRDRWIKKAQWIPMVAGIRKKIYQSGEVTSLVARAVYKNDEFEFSCGDDESIVHKPTLAEPGEMIAVYAVATLKDGSRVREIMRISDVNRIRSMSKSKDTGPWVTHFEQMALKTVIKRIAKSLPFSAEIEDTIYREDSQRQIGEYGRAAEAAPVAQIDSSDAYEDAEYVEVDEDGVISDASPEPEQATREPAPAASSSNDEVSSTVSLGTKESMGKAMQAGYDAALSGRPANVPAAYERYLADKRAWVEGYERGMQHVGASGV